VNWGIVAIGVCFLLMGLAGFVGRDYWVRTQLESYDTSRRWLRGHRSKARSWGSLWIVVLTSLAGGLVFIVLGALDIGFGGR
jgi:hypothetical protein